MDTRQFGLEKLVVEYFKTRRDTQLRRAAEGVYVLRLMSSESRSQFGGQEELRLTFNADQAFHHPDWELINATHPYLDVIRNDLTSQTDDPRISEAHFSAQPVSPTGGVKLPYVELDGPVSKVDFNTDYHPYFVLAYKVVFEADERQDYILHLCFDARTGEARDEAVAHLARLPLGEGRHPSISNRGDLADLGQVLKQGRAEIDARVRREVAAIETQYAEQLTKEKDRLERHYKSEIELTSRRDEDGRQKLRENLKKEIEDFERKYTCRSRASLISTLLLWAPILHYRVGATSKRSGFVLDGFSYESCTDSVIADACHKCGNRQRFRLCCAGKHAVCGDILCTATATCSMCGDSYCPIHGRNCSHCHQPTCFADHAACSYGKHPLGSKFCPRCTRSSFEEKIICAGCGEDCDLCTRTFPSELVLSCSVGAERFCSRHNRDPDGDLCSECRKPVCKVHGRETQESVWACNQHSHAASCCGHVFGDSRLIGCVEDGSELLCPHHRLSCAVCGLAICQRHVVRSWQHEPLCSKDKGQCIQCHPQPEPRIHRRDRLQSCVICHGPVCAEHVQKCPVCETRVFCTVHQDSQPACESCGRVSCATTRCSPNSSTCTLCGMGYCRHCVAQDGICATCAHPDPLSRVSQAFPLLEKIAGMPDEHLKKTAQIMLKSFKECSVLSSENRTYRVIVIQHQPSRWFFWRRGRRLRVVVTRDDEVLHVRLEKAT